VDTNKPNCILAFDFGTRQIGLAVGQTLTSSCRPLAILKAKDGKPNWEDVTTHLAAWSPALLIVGLPLNIDGTESPFCLRARKFARRLHGRTGLPVQMVDERLSTAEAKTLSKRPDSYRKNPVDSEAASLILETWLYNRDIGLQP